MNELPSDNWWIVITQLSVCIYKYFLKLQTPYMFK